MLVVDACAGMVSFRLWAVLGRGPATLLGPSASSRYVPIELCIVPPLGRYACQQH